MGGPASKDSRCSSQKASQGTIGNLTDNRQLFSLPHLVAACLPLPRGQGHSRRGRQGDQHALACPSGVRHMAWAACLHPQKYCEQWQNARRLVWHAAVAACRQRPAGWRLL